MNSVLTSDRQSEVAFEQLPDGAYAVHIHAAKGVYELSLELDGAEFDWESLYVDWHNLGHGNQRTGPWDFSPLTLKPVVPSYWVKLDGKRLGLWFCQRISLEDLAAQVFRGRLAFQFDAGGRHRLDFQPYSHYRVTWSTVAIAPDLMSFGKPLPLLRDAARHCPATTWAKPETWMHLRERLAEDELVRNLLAGALEDPGTRRNRDDDLALNLAAWFLHHDETALSRALAIVDQLLEADSFNGRASDAYGYNGDMMAAVAMRQLSWALRMIPDVLARRRSRILERLAEQGKAFVKQAMLNRDYWGGSILQDHGWQSHFAFGTAALTLLGLLPEAEDWLLVVLARVDLCLAAMPRDGVLPAGSHRCPHNYLDELTYFRDTWLALSDEDLFDRGPFREILDFLHASSLPTRPWRLVVANAASSIIRPPGGLLFLSRMADKYPDSPAAGLLGIHLDDDWSSLDQRVGKERYARNLIWTLLAGAPSSPNLPPPHEGLAYFADGGYAVYSFPGDDAKLALQCGPTNGHHAYSQATGPCDRLGGPPIAGHFNLHFGAIPMLATAEPGYRLSTESGSVALVDGVGQTGDVGYPMSIPSWRWPGERIAATRSDSEECEIVLDLQPAYPASAHLLRYTRQLIIRDQEVVCRDRLQLSQPHHIQWLWQVRRSVGYQLEGLAAAIGGGRKLYLCPRSATDLGVSSGETAVVYSYASHTGCEPVDHIRYTTLNATTVLDVDFVFTWLPLTERPGD